MLYVHYYYAAEDDDANDDDGGDEDDDDGGDFCRCMQCVGDCPSSFRPLHLALYANISTTTSCWRVAHQHHQRLVKERGLPCVATPAGD